MSAGEPFVLVRAGEVACALPARDVLETMRPLPTVPLAGAPDCVGGVARIRGEPVPVVALARLIGGGPEPGGGTAPARFVTVRAEGRRVALAVEAVAGVRRVPPDVVATLPPLLAEAAGASVTAVGTLDGALLLVLRAARLVPPEAWRALAAAEAAG